MKCRICGGRAVFHMPQHRLALCRDDYIAWFQKQVERTIRRHRMFNRQDRVLVAVSGGKDSLALWDALLELGYRASGLYIDLGIDEGEGYSKVSYEKVKAFAAERGNPELIVVDVARLYGLSIPEKARQKRGRATCSVCGLTKRHIMNRIAREGGFAAVATGHNLDDEAAVLLMNVLHWQTGYLARQGPVLEEREGLARKVKPLYRFRERETAAYALLKGIDYIEAECPFAEGATSIFAKELLTQLEARSPGSLLQFYEGFLKNRGLFEGAVREATETALHACEACGQPTTAPGRCAFCRLWDQVGVEVKVQPAEVSDS